MIRFKRRAVSPELASLYRSLNAKALFEERLRDQPATPPRTTVLPASGDVREVRP